MQTNPYQPSHRLSFGVEGTAIDPKTKAVTTAVCLFCQIFGREEGKGRKRIKTGAKSFENFRTDAYEHHLNTAHPEQWEKYQKLTSIAAREAFFDPSVRANTLHAHLVPSGSFRVRVKRDIVETVLGVLMVNPNDMNGTGRKQTLGLFRAMSDDEDEEKEFYEHVCVTARRFRMCIKIVSRGSTFRATSLIMDDFAIDSGMSIYRGCTEAYVSNQTQVVLAHSLQIFSEVAKHLWCFSLALDGSTHQGLSYLDVRWRFHWKGSIQNFHLVALPVFERHSGEYMFEILQTFLLAVFGKPWTQKCICVSSDGAANMMGNTRGLVTRIASACVEGMGQVWCGLHQLDVVMQRAFTDALEKTFCGYLTGLISHLRRQQKLVAEMQMTCPKLASTRWMSVAAVSQWFVRHQFRIMKSLEEKSPPCTPDKKWWIFLHVIQVFAEQSKMVFTSLQGRETLITEQRKTMSALLRTYAGMCDIRGPLSPERIQELRANEPCVYSDRFILTESNIRKFLFEEQISWVGETLLTLEDSSLSSLMTSVGRLFVDAAEGIFVTIEAEDPPPVLPYELYAIEKWEFKDTLTLYNKRLGFLFDKDGITAIEHEFLALRRAMEHQPQPEEELPEEEEEKKVYEGFRRVGFQEAWKPFHGKYPHLQGFCGGLASAFPNTATVESDFSVLGWENKGSRMNLTDISLEGALHSKQYEDVKKLEQGLPSETPEEVDLTDV